MSDDAEPAAERTAEAPASNGAGTEKYKQRAVLLRVMIYIFATHLFAGFVILLFYLGQHAHK
ncbi:DUF6126 family protein [Actinacidiphila soli]|jgi:hypothetical protein|uniref:DUF6126 family protein n=1 Tax=Actinacidiphila soli TaxID=2487275 RepID=UPI000FCA4526|nr:DUF6126 family protein [Actinacidiphila soli]